MPEPLRRGFVKVGGTKRRWSSSPPFAEDRGVELPYEHMFATGWDEGLDDEQLAVAMHGDAPLVVVAGAGTGKTRALTSRVASLLDRGVPPDRILLLTYTRRAASDMLARAARLVGVQREDSPTGGTFHAIAYRHVAAYAEVLDLPKTFGVLDPDRTSVV